MSVAAELSEAQWRFLGELGENNMVFPSKHQWRPAFILRKRGLATSLVVDGKPGEESRIGFLVTDRGRELLGCSSPTATGEKR